MMRALAIAAAFTTMIAAPMANEAAKPVVKKAYIENGVQPCSDGAEPIRKAGPLGTPIQKVCPSADLRDRIPLK